jgi:hypothetical protein
MSFYQVKDELSVLGMWWTKKNMITLMKSPLFSTGIEAMPLTNIEEINYLRSDHEKSVWVQQRK